MNRRMISAFLAALLCAGLAVPAAAAEVDSDAVYCFSSTDFSADEALAGICITGLPDSGTGTVMLGARVLRTGDILTAQQLEQMTFHPLKTETDREATVTYLPIYQDRVEAAAAMSVAVIGKTDQAPVAQDSAMETYRNLPNEAMLKVSDPEGQAMTYTVTRTPKRGDVTIREDGSFIYTPKKNKVGVDSFTYTATDPAGNVSKEATVTIKILKPTDSTQYQDTVGLDCRFEAEWLRNTGLFAGEQVGGRSCFQPEKAVSKGEFTALLLETLNAPVEEQSAYTGLAQDAPDWLKPYLAAAVRSGLLTGLTDTFTAADPISGAEAAVMLQNALDLAVTQTMAVEETATAAELALAAMNENGFALSADQTLTRADCAVLLYQLSITDAPGKAVFNLQSE